MHMHIETLKKKYTVHVGDNFRPPLDIAYLR